jgi:hypothetical protein
VRARHAFKSSRFETRSLAQMSVLGKRGNPRIGCVRCVFYLPGNVFPSAKA